jgi:hypothetical protein
MLDRGVDFVNDHWRGPLQKKSPGFASRTLITSKKLETYFFFLAAFFLAAFFFGAAFFLAAFFFVAIFLEFNV